MNDKKAKKLRKWARANSVGRSLVGYRRDARGVVMVALETTRGQYRMAKKAMS